MIFNRSKFMNNKGISMYFTYADSKLFKIDDSYRPLFGIEYDEKYFSFLNDVLDRIRKRFYKYVNQLIFPDIKYARTVMNETPEPFGVAAYIDGNNRYIYEAVKRGYIRLLTQDLLLRWKEVQDKVTIGATIKLSSYGGPFFYDHMKHLLNEHYRDDIRYLTRLASYMVLNSRGKTEENLPPYDEVVDYMLECEFGACIKTRSQFNSFICDDNGCKPKPRKTYIPIDNSSIKEVEQNMNSSRIPGASRAKRRHVTAFDKIFTIYSMLRVMRALLDTQLYVYPSTYITKGPDDLALKIRGMYVVGTDTSMFDKGLNKGVLDQFLETLYNHFKGTEKEWDIIIKSHFPMLITALPGDQVFIDEYNDSKGWYLLSGLSNTTLLGHITGTAVAMVVLEDTFGIEWSMENLRKFLKWELDFKIKNKGDDTLFIFASKEDKMRFLNTIDTDFLEPQIADEFIGLKVVYDDDGSVSDVIHDVVRSWFNFLNPENSITSPFRRCAWIGYESRKKNLKHPFVHEIQLLIEESYQQIYGSSLFSNVIISKSRCNVNTNELNEDEILFLDNPEVVFYKVDPTKIRAEIFNQFFLPLNPQMIKDNVLI